MRPLRAGTPAFVAACFAVACAPALDWREYVPEDSGISVTLPCRGDRQARPVMLAGRRATMEMVACPAAETTWAVSFFDVAEPAQVAPALAEWRSVMVGNINGSTAAVAPVAIKGMTSSEQAVRVRVDGTLPDGSAVHEHAAFFSRGLRVYSASAIGRQPSPQAVEVFFAGLKFPG